MTTQLNNSIFEDSQEANTTWKMASVFVIPSFGLQRTTYPCCGFHGSVRPRYQYRRQSENPSSLGTISQLLQSLADDEFDDKDITFPSLLLKLRERVNKKETSSEGKAKSVDSSLDEQTPDKFKVSVDLGEAFKPDEISVKIVDKTLKIEGKHEEKGEDGDFTSRQFTRSYRLPDDVNLEQLTSSLSFEGVLNVEAPRLVKEELKPAERNIPIEQGQTSSAIKTNEELEGGEDKVEGAKSDEEAMEEESGKVREN